MKTLQLPGVDICRFTFYFYTATCSLVSKPEEARRPGIVFEEPIRRRHRRGSDAEIICVWQRMLSTTRAESLGLSPGALSAPNSPNLLAQTTPLQRQEIGETRWGASGCIRSSVFLFYVCPFLDPPCAKAEKFNAITPDLFECIQQRCSLKNDGLLPDTRL